MKKIRSSAIYYALFLSVIFGLIIGGFVLLSGFNQRFALEMDVEEILLDNARSGIAYGQVNFKELTPNKEQAFRLFGDGVDSVRVLKKRWGAFTIIRSKAVHGNKAQTKIGLFGGVQPEKLPNLYLADKGRSVALCGDTRIEGNCFLPRAGVKRAYIEGKNYRGTKLIYGTVNESKKQLPKIQPDFLTRLNFDDSEFQIWEDELDTFRNSFDQQVIRLLDDDFIHLDKVIEGQVLVEAKDSIFVARDAQIENAILKSKVVYVESGFSGALQIYASERVILEDRVQLKYPSVVGLVEEEYPTEQTAEIRLAEHSQIIGAVFLMSLEPNFRFLPRLAIAPDSEVDGLVYCSGKVELKGTISGSLYTEKFYLKTASSAYENHLLNGQLLDQLPADFVVPDLLHETATLKHIAWLE